MRGKGIVFLAEEQFYAVPYLLGVPWKLKMRHGYQSVTVGNLAVLWIGSRLSSRYCFPLSFVWYGSRIIGSRP